MGTIIFLSIVGVVCIVFFVGLMVRRKETKENLPSRGEGKSGDFKKDKGYYE